MEFLGIGPSELIFIIIIALIVLGPRDMQKAGKTIGKWMRDIVTSDGWKAFQQTSREVRDLPTRLMREANEELRKAENTTINPASDSAGTRYSLEEIDQRPSKSLLPAEKSVSIDPTASQPPQVIPIEPQTDSSSNVTESSESTTDQNA